MKDFVVSVRKLTDTELMREACESTFIGKSETSLLSIYKAEHSPARTQLFWIKLENIPLFVSTHLIRHHVGSVPFQLSCREDRKGGNSNFQDKLERIITDLNSESNDVSSTVANLEWLKENTDRQTPVNLSLLVNAQGLIDMAKLRLCTQAHKETRTVFEGIKNAIKEVDPELFAMLVPKCIYRNGLCGEMRCCGYNTTPAFGEALKDYKQNFTNKQCGIRTKF